MKFIHMWTCVFDHCENFVYVTQVKFFLEVKEYIQKSILTISFNDIKPINSMNLKHPQPASLYNKANLSR